MSAPEYCVLDGGLAGWAAPEGMRKAEGNDRELVREALYGITILTQRCTECGWIEASRVAGQLDLNEYAEKVKG